MEIGKEGEPFIAEPLEDPVPGRRFEPPPEPTPSPQPVPEPDREPVPA